MAYTDVLLKGFHIKLEDLEANRKGKLSRRQVFLMVRGGVANLLGGFLIGLVLAGILVWVADKPLRPIQWILALGLFLAAMSVGVRDLLRTGWAAADPRVACLKGTVRTHRAGSAGWYLSVAGRSLKIPVRFWTFEDDVPYRVYVAVHAGRIVAIEPDGWE